MDESFSEYGSSHKYRHVSSVSPPISRQDTIPIRVQYLLVKGLLLQIADGLLPGLRHCYMH